MIKQLLFITALLPFLFIHTGCSESKNKELPSSSTKQKKDPAALGNSPEKNADKEEQKQDLADFLPEGTVVFDQMNGDLNKDGLKDLVLIIKGTNKSNFVKDEYRGELDRNRRGCIVLFRNKNGYELAAKNVDCFSSENEDGGVYFPPELVVSVEKGKLYVHYAHGRYGYWKYTFRYKNGDFELIGYDASDNYGPVINREISINFLSKRKQEKVNVNENAESGEEVFNESWEDIHVNKLIRLSEIEDFDELNVTD